MKKFYLQKKNHNGLFIVLLVISMIFWGANWISVKRIIDYSHIQFLTFVRLFVSTIFYLPLMLLFKQSFKISLKQFFIILISSIVLVFYYQAMFGGLKYGLAGYGGILVTTLIPIFTYLYTLIFHKEKPSFRECIALFLGFAGGLIILKFWNLSFESIMLGGNIFFLISAMLWGLLTLNSQKVQKDMTVWVYSFYLHLFASFFQFPFTVVHIPAHLFSFDSVFWLNVIYITAIATNFANTVYFYASSKIGSQKASSFIFVVPVSAMFSAWIFLNEKPVATTLLGGALAILAVYLINIWKMKSIQKTD